MFPWPNCNLAANHTTDAPTSRCTRSASSNFHRFEKCLVRSYSSVRPKICNKTRPDPIRLDHTKTGRTEKWQRIRLVKSPTPFPHKTRVATAQFATAEARPAVTPYPSKSRQVKRADQTRLVRTRRGRVSALRSMRSTLPCSPCPRSRWMRKKRGRSREGSAAWSFAGLRAGPGSSRGVAARAARGGTGSRCSCLSWTIFQTSA